MNIKLVIGLVGIAAGTLGFVIGSKLTASNLTKRQKEMEAKYAADLNKLQKELSEMKRVFTDSQKPEDAEKRQEFWNKVSGDLKKSPEDREKDDIITIDVEHDKSDLLYSRPDEEKTNYNKYVEPYSTVDATTDPKSIIRREAQNGIVEIEEWVYRETRNSLPSEDLQYHELSTDVYFDDEEMMDPGDIPLYVGYTQEELAMRFLSDDDLDRIIIRNSDHGKFYIIYRHEGAI